MTKPTLETRSSGILHHPTSLPGPHGIGDIGRPAEQFVRFLADAGQAWWQMLPVGPPGGGGVSPYYATSAFAGNPLLVGLDGLFEDGLLSQNDLAPDRSFPPDQIRFGEVTAFKTPRFRRAFAAFAADRNPDLQEEFYGFRSSCSGWLPDFALFCALKDAHGGRAWSGWPEDLRSRKPSALAGARARLETEVHFHEFIQFAFHRQWTRLRTLAHSLDIGLIGDAPIFVAHDSADVWANPDLFCLDKQGRPTVQAGVPPDYFAKTGQLWGNPLYRWERMRERGYDWWLARLSAILQRFDAVRLDHFIGFHRCWEIPADAETAEHGRWVYVPGRDFFETVQRSLGRIPLIAEDLGIVVPEVKELRDRFHFPGMRVLQFAFGTDLEADNYRPHSYPRRCVVYTGTHDNDTTTGWWNDRGSEASTRTPEQIEREREVVRLYTGTDGKRIAWDMIRVAMVSVADLAVFPIQDLLGLGSEARMNKPGTQEGNWGWRQSPDSLTPESGQALRAMTKVTGRLPPRS